MQQFTVRFLPSERTVAVPEGTTVLDAARLAGVSIAADCGGVGTCGRCLVRIQEGGASCHARACAVRIAADLTVAVPCADDSLRVLTEGRARTLPFLPVAVDVSIVGSFVAAAARRPYAMLAFDVGTTTVVAYLLSGETGALLAAAGAKNPQTLYGADVIARVQYAVQHGTEPLTTGIRNCLAALTRTVARRADVDPKTILTVSIAGNTCMHHLLLGLSPQSLATAPYAPTMTELCVTDAAALALPVHPAAKAILLPNIAGFIGSDTVAGMLACGMEHVSSPTLLLDVGTNGELALATPQGAFVCSTAAGPALEGRSIRCGMRGADGAIDHVQWADGRLTFSVLGGGSPLGICGSGLIDLIAALLHAGAIDATGRMCPDGCAALFERFFTLDGQPALLLFDGETPVVLTQADVREVQLAKGAIRAGITLLLRRAGLLAAEVERVLLAGAFGSTLSPASACKIGLLPPAWRDRITPVGNAAGLGAMLTLKNAPSLQTARQLARSAVHLELANEPEFQDTFIDALSFDAQEQE